MAMSNHRKVLMCLTPSWKYSSPPQRDPNTKKYKIVPTSIENNCNFFLGMKCLGLAKRPMSHRMV